MSRTRITLSCEAALRDLVRAVEMWQKMLPLPPNIEPATRMARIALREAAETSVSGTEHDLFYLRSILRNLDELRQVSMEQVEAVGYGVANEALEDNRDWLDCFIARFCDTAAETPCRNHQKPANLRQETDKEQVR
jgi:hypothetical protein